MAKISGTGSLGIKKSLGHKKGYTQYDSASPHYSMTIEREVPDGLTDDELEEKATELLKRCKGRVEKQIAEDLAEIIKVD